MTKIMFSRYFLILFIFFTFSCDNSTESKNQPPNCSILSPSVGSIYKQGDTIDIVVDAKDEDGYIIEVRFYLNDNPHGSDNEFPYVYSISTMNLNSGDHIITVMAIDNEGGETKNYLNFSISPFTPTNLQVTQKTITSAELSWSNIITLEEKFEIERKTAQESVYEKISEVDAGISSDHNWIDLDIVPNITYNYRVRGVKGDIYSDYITQTFYNVFPQPTDFSYIKEAIDKISISWKDNSNGESGFKIDKKVGVSEWVTEYGVSGANTVSWTDNNAELNQNIQYRVYGYMDNYESAKTTTSVIDNTIPQPTELDISQTTITSSLLNWEDNSIGEDKFIIQRKLNTEPESSFSVIAEVTGDDNFAKQWEDTALEPNLIYDYRVKAEKIGHESSYTQATFNNLFPAPTELTPSVLNETEIKIDWNVNSIGEDGFIIDRKVGSEANWNENHAIVGSGVNNWTDTGLLNGTFYSYRVKAYYGTDLSNYSNEVVAATIDLNRFVEIPTGSFNMGHDSIDYATPVHLVHITRQYYLDRYELTQKEWTKYMPQGEYNYGTGDDHPAYGINWYASLKYCNLRSIAEGLEPCYAISGTTNPLLWGDVPTQSNSVWDAALCDWTSNGYRLPSEAEWEYAARYNDQRDYPWGNELPTVLLSNYGDNVGSTTPVGSYTSGNSSLGLSDMAGNILEWVWDAWQNEYPSETQTDPTGSNFTYWRLLRGGVWSGFDYYLHSSFRSVKPLPSNSFYLYGLRLARTK